MNIEVNRTIPYDFPEEWDRLLHSNCVYNSSRFLKVIQESNIENSTILFGGVFENEKLISTCVWSVFTVNLDLMVDEVWLKSILKKIPKVSKVKMLVLGTPISLGQSHLVLPKEISSRKEACSLIMEKSNELAQEYGAKIICAKEFKEGEIDGELLEKFGFLKGNSLPFYKSDLLWDNYNQYLGELKHSYRRRIKKSLAKLSPEALSWYSEPRVGRYNELFYDKLNNINVEEFYPLYLSVISRAEVVLEILPKDFFESLKKRLGGEIECVCIYDDNSLKSLALLWPTKESLHWMLVGRESNMDNLDTYNNTLNAVMSLAISKKKKCVYLGQTSSHVKRQVGAIPMDISLWIKSNRKSVQLILKLLLNTLFPSSDEKAYNVFKAKKAI